MSVPSGLRDVRVPKEISKSSEVPRLPAVSSDF